MELDQLLHRWELLDQKIDYALARQASMARELALEATRRRLTHESIRPALDLAFALVVALASGSCLGNHWQEPSVVLPALTLLIAAIVFLIDNIRQLELLSSLRWDGSITSKQSALTRLRHARIRQLRWILLFAPLLGLCMLSVGAMQLLGLNAWELMTRINRAWAWGNLGFALLFVPLAYWISHAISRRWQGHPALMQILDDLSGTSLNRARRELDHWATIERDGPA